MLTIYLFKKRLQRYYFYPNPQNFPPKIAKKISLASAYS